jgi:hypothetical protein
MASNWYKDFMAGAGVEVGSHTPDKPTPYNGPPMDLENMRANGVRSLLVSCLDCHHHATVRRSYGGALNGAVIRAQDEVQRLWL